MSYGPLPVRLLLALLIAFGPAIPAHAHEMRPFHLEITETEPEIYDITWTVPARENSIHLALEVRFVDDVETLQKPVGEISGTAYFERWRIRRNGGLVGTPVSIDGLVSTFTDVIVHVSLLDRTSQSVLLTPDNPSFVIAYQPDRWEVAGTYFQLGAEHILLGLDHLLVVLGLLLLVSDRWMRVKTITAFILAQSIALELSVFSIIRVPQAPLNVAIALSVLFVGLELVQKSNRELSFTIRHLWFIASAFGLLHGVGFAGGLSPAGVPHSEIPSASVFFNLGIEAGLLAFVLVALLVAGALRTLEMDRPQWVTQIPGYAIGSLGAYWTIQRILPILKAP